MLKDRFTQRALAALALVSLLAGLTIAADAASAHHHRARHHTQARAYPHGRARHRHNGHRASAELPQTADPATHPNIVFVLTDDLSMNLLQYMPNVLTMQQQGLTFNNYYVSDSLCCPSRASIFGGNFPHDTGVYTNTGKHGGFNQFYARGEGQHTFATALHQAGYRTAMMGKYLNGYMGTPAKPAAAPPTYVPPGWDQWDVAGWGYPEFNYTLNDNGACRATARPAGRLSDRRAVEQGIELHRQLGGRAQAVLPGGGDVRPPPSVHAGAAQPLGLPRAEGPAGAEFRHGCRQTHRAGWRAARRSPNPASTTSTTPTASARSPSRRSTPRSARSGAR